MLGNLIALTIIGTIYTLLMCKLCAIIVAHTFRKVFKDWRK